MLIDVYLTYRRFKYFIGFIFCYMTKTKFCSIFNEKKQYFVLVKSPLINVTYLPYLN